jgi:Xaa-Pro aminopeptidase
MSSDLASSARSRRQEVRKALEAAGVNTLVVVHLPNIQYLTGFAGTAGILVVRRDAAQLIVDSRYLTAAAAIFDHPSASDLTLVPVDHTYDETIAAVLAGSGQGRVGFEAAHVSVSRFTWLTRRVDVELVPLEGVVEACRLVKDASELAALRRGGSLLSEVAVETVGRVAPDRTEREIAAELDWTLKRAGFSRPAFETIVASGPNSALPHARPTDRTLRRGDLVVLDFGGVYDGYCVDLTRTVSIGEPSPEQQALYGAVLEAQGAAIRCVAPGRLASAIDAAARDVLTARGFGQYFGHGTGHGLGLEIHEEPRIGKRRTDRDDDPRDQPVRPGMVFTVEPGAYVPGFGGVRLEDDVLVTAEGCEVLTSAPRDLHIIR